jgi:hypothetical protein
MWTGCCCSCGLFAAAGGGGGFTARAGGGKCNGDCSGGAAVTASRGMRLRGTPDGGPWVGYQVVPGVGGTDPRPVVAQGPGGTVSGGTGVPLFAGVALGGLFGALRFLVEALGGGGGGVGGGGCGLECHKGIPWPGTGRNRCPAMCIGGTIGGVAGAWGGAGGATF